nr:unnamed protein product [Callosobruchus chinensis]
MRRLQALETCIMRRMLKISWTKHDSRTNEHTERFIFKSLLPNKMQSSDVSEKHHFIGYIFVGWQIYMYDFQMTSLNKNGRRQFYEKTVFENRNKK